MAMWGILRTWAEASDWAKVMPPAALIASRPRVPSESPPDSTTPMALSPRSRASDSKKPSMALLIRWLATRGWSRSRPPSRVSRWLGGITYTWLGAIAMSSAIACTGIGVVRAKISLSKLPWVGSRCCTSTMAMPVSAGRWVSSWVKASSPPAEAPTPTTGKRSPSGAKG